MGKRFFKIVGIFSYGAAALALIVAIGLGVIAAGNFFGSVNEEIAEPVTTLERYQSEKKLDLEAQAAAARKPANPAAEAEEEDEADKKFFAALEPLFQRICGSIDKFAGPTKQSTVDCGGLENYLVENTEELDRDAYLVFLGALAQETEGLAAKASAIVKAQKDSPSYVEWSEFVTWFTSDYMQQYREELERIQSEQVEQAAAKIASLTTAAAAAVAFLVFVFFTMILLLVQIELNTRKTEEAVADLKEPATKTEMNTHAAALALRKQS